MINNRKKRIVALCVFILIFSYASGTRDQMLREAIILRNDPKDENLWG